MDHTFQEHFKYTHNNPYHDKLTEFGDFLLRDEDSETNKGEWNQKVFGREGVLCAEIGSGYGHFMMDYCEKHPEVNFVGMDFRFKRTFYLAKKLAAHPTKNFKYLRARGERLKFIFGENEVDHMFYFFPDPWPKKKHAKNRLFQSEFIRDLAAILKPQRTAFIVTDDETYKGQVIDHFLENIHFRPEFPKPYFINNFEAYGQSFFNDLWVNKGRNIYYMSFIRE